MTPQFIVHPVLAPDARNAFLLFVKRFNLSEIPDDAPFHLFADTRYRLIVNGQIVGYGPTRFYPDAPEFDSYNLASLLKVGSNEVRVEVNSRNASSYQAAPSQAGFWAQGAFGGVDLGTPGDWQVKISSARASFAPPFSFAQGPVEILDVAALEEEWKDETGWETPVITTGWGEISARSLPQSPFPLQDEAQLLLQTSLLADEERLGFYRPILSTNQVNLAEDPLTIAVALSLYSPVEQSVVLGMFWGDNYFNGESLSLQTDPQRGNRQYAEVKLRAGWNLFYAQHRVLKWGVGFLLGWPHSANLRVAPEGLRTSEALPLSKLNSVRGELPTQPQDLENARWLTPLSEWPHSVYPGREVGWDIPEHSDDNQNEVEQDANNHVLVKDGGGAGVAVWDLKREFLGHVRLEIEAEQEVVVDVAVDERRRDDGLLAIYSTNPFIDAVDRFVLPAGTSQIEAFHPRGGQFLQVTVRSSGAVKLRNIQMRSALLHLEQQGQFECSDSLLNEIWRTGAATTEACLPDVWVDCPWREQGAYMGDTLVEFHATRALSSHTEMGRRALRMWAQGQCEDGTMPGCSPAWLPLPQGDFSLIYILLVRDYWAQSGDDELVREVWPTMQRILASPLGKSDETGLLEATPENPIFIDWGIPNAERVGKANGALNAFRIGALQAVSELAHLVGEDSSSWNDEAMQATDAFRRLLWRPERQDFAPYLGETTADAHHTNALALRFGIATPEQIPGVLNNLRAARARMQYLDELKQRDGHLELYFLHFVLEALAAQGEHDEALGWIREAWSPIIRASAVTFWETLHHGLHDKGSLCHAWSCAPLWFLSRELLGVRPVTGKPDSFRIAPHSAGLTWARGVYPHSRGPIEVFWRRENGQLQVEFNGPQGVSLELS